MEIWSFESIHCINFNMQHQKHHDVTNDIKVNLLIRGFVGCKKNMLFFALTYLFIILSMSAMEYAEKLTLIHFCLKFA